MRYVDMPRYRRSGVRIPTMYIVDTHSGNAAVGEIYLNDFGRRVINPSRQALANRVLFALNATGPLGVLGA